MRQLLDEKHRSFQYAEALISVDSYCSCSMFHESNEVTIERKHNGSGISKGK